MASKLEHALALAAKGFKVFPIKDGQKTPPLVKNWPQWATTMPAQISEWWAYGEHNIGIHCEGLLVVDVDAKKGGIESFGQLDDMLGLPPTLMHATPTGGRHVIYRLPEGHPGAVNSVEVLGKGLDVRSTHGYIVAPGSTVAAGEYTVHDEPGIAEAPAWLVQKAGTFTKREQPVADVPDAPDAVVEHAMRWLETAERSVKGAGGDQAAYRVACQLRDFGLSYQQACEAMRSDAWDMGCGWRDGWLEEKPIASAYKYAQNAEGGTKAIATASMFQAQEPAAAERKSEARKARVQRAEDLADEPLVYDYLVKNWLERGTYALLYGESGQGKTFTALDIAFHVATGREWRGNKVREGLALYLAFEGKGGIKRRLRALRKHYGSLGKLWAADASMNLRTPEGCRELGEMLAALPEKPSLIVIDTFARAMMGGDENSAQDTGAFGNAIEGLIEETGACVLVIHHSGKNKAAGARGSSAIKAALDTEIEIDSNQIVSHKQRDGENPQTLGFRLRPVDIGMDADGQLLRSCVVEPAEAPPAMSGRPLKGNAAHAFNILCELTGPENAPVSESRWIAKMMAEGMGRSTAYKWLRDLKKEGRVTVEDEMVTRRMH